jgi:hypothetical protein
MDSPSVLPEKVQVRTVQWKAKVPEGRNHFLALVRSWTHWMSLF